MGCTWYLRCPHITATGGVSEMSEEGDIDVESAEDVPDIAVEATATTVEDRSEVYSPTVSGVSQYCTLTKEGPLQNIGPTHFELNFLSKSLISTHM